MEGRFGTPEAGVGATRPIESWTSAVSWAAIIAGAFVAAATSLVLVALGSGIGFASVSPWAYRTVSATTFTVMTGIWLIVVQWLASGVGGYITGRLRTKWVGVHTHEVFFRDTAQGFLTWAVATVIGVMLLASAASALIGSGVRSAATVASGAAEGLTAQAVAGREQSGASPVGGYDLDLLFRSDRPNPNPSPADSRAEAGRILAKGLIAGDMPAADRAYLAQMVAARTGISQADAEKRVDDAIAQLKAAELKAQQVTDTARKGASASLIFTALSMLVGAFIACAAAALGGKHRDEQP